jgi:hypothetical protein
MPAFPCLVYQLTKTQNKEGRGTRKKESCIQGAKLTIVKTSWMILASHIGLPSGRVDARGQGPGVLASSGSLAPCTWGCLQSIRKTLQCNLTRIARKVTKQGRVDIYVESKTQNGRRHDQPWWHPHVSEAPKHWSHPPLTCEDKEHFGMLFLKTCLPSAVLEVQ